MLHLAWAIMASGAMAMGQGDPAPLSFEVTASFDAEGVPDAQTRLLAAREALRRNGSPDAPLIATAIAGQTDMLRLRRSGPAQVEVRLEDRAALDSAARAMDAVVSIHGGPRTSVDSERPAHPSDRAVTAMVTSELASLGIQPTEARWTRALRTDAADRAVAQGQSAETARRAMEGMPDFAVRVSAAESSRAESAYGIAITRCTASVRLEALHMGSGEPLETDAVTVETRAREATRAEAEALASASAAAARALAIELAVAWMELASGRRGCIIEIEGGLPGGGLPAGQGPPPEVLENRPGVLTRLRLRPGDGRMPDDFGTPLLQRPGYAVVMSTGAGGPWFWVAGSAAAIATVAAAVLGWRRHARPASQRG